MAAHKGFGLACRAQRRRTHQAHHNPSPRTVAEVCAITELGGPEGDKPRDQGAPWARRPGRPARSGPVRPDVRWSNRSPPHRASESDGRRQASCATVGSWLLHVASGRAVEA
eukprot:42854-Prymnesium_polylepis.1